MIFNLTGGFKSIQAFLQAVGQFYADESVYVFEGSTELLRIPRLPVKLDAAGTIRNRLAVFRRLAAVPDVKEVEAAGIDGIYLFCADGQADLSPWGKLMWNLTHSGIYEEQVHPSPDPRIEFSRQFLNSVRDLPANRNREVNRRVDQLLRYLWDKANPRGLDVKPLRGDHAPSTHECDAWHDGGARRILFHYRDSNVGKTIVLDELREKLPG